MPGLNLESTERALRLLELCNKEISSALENIPEPRERLIRHIDRAIYFKYLAIDEFPSILNPDGSGITSRDLYLFYFDLWAVLAEIGKTLTKLNSGGRLGPGDHTIQEEIEWVRRLIRIIDGWFDTILSDECEDYLNDLADKLQKLLELLEAVDRGKAVSDEDIRKAYDSFYALTLLLDRLGQEEGFDYLTAFQELAEVDRYLEQAKHHAHGERIIDDVLRALLQEAKRLKDGFEVLVRKRRLNLPTHQGAPEPGEPKPGGPGSEDLPPFPPPGYAFRKVEVNGRLTINRIATLTIPVGRKLGPAGLKYVAMLKNRALGLPGSTLGALAAFVRPNVELHHCRVYRVWRNGTDQDLNRTVSVYPNADTFPGGSRVTVFVASDDHTGAPGVVNSPTTVSPTGDSVVKKVPSGWAVFVHYDRGESPLESTRVEIGHGE